MKSTSSEWVGKLRDALAAVAVGDIVLTGAGVGNGTAVKVDLDAFVLDTDFVSSEELARLHGPRPVFRVSDIDLLPWGDAE